LGKEEKKIKINSILGKRGRKETVKNKRKQKKKFAITIWCPRWQQREKKINNVRTRFFALSSSLYIRRRFTIPTCGNIRYILTFKKKTKTKTKRKG
jgi:hypothetical protein